MITASANITNMIDSPVRSIVAKVELYNGSTLVNTFASTDKLISFSLEREASDGKFFGYGVLQHLVVKLIDKQRELAITTANTMKIAYGVGEEWVYPHPDFKVTQTRRDEKTNQLTVYGYDLSYDSVKYKVADLTIDVPYTVKTFVEACATTLGCAGVTILGQPESDNPFALSFATGANFSGEESVKDAMNDAAEVTQTIYYIDNTNHLVFKRMDKDCI